MKSQLEESKSTPFQWKLWKWKVSTMNKFKFWRKKWRKMLEDRKLSNIHASKELILYNRSSSQKSYTMSMQTQSKSQGYSSSTYKKQSEIYVETQKTMTSQRKYEGKDKCYRYHHPKLCKRVILLKYIHHGSHTHAHTQ